MTRGARTAMCLAMAGAMLMSGRASAQWLHLPTPGLPRTPDGKPNLTAPAPRGADGKPDFSGLWQKSGDKYYNNIAADLKPGDVAPWADALYRERRLDFGKDSMQTRCIPRGPAYTLSPYEQTRIVQTPTLVAMVNNDQTHREIFMDGRSLEPDPNPTWMGYSVAHWDGDTLVVDSNGYTDRSWADADGHPHTEALRVTERYVRRDVGHIDLRVTFTDPTVFPAPVTVPMVLELQPDTEMLEFVCENERDRAHMTTIERPKEIMLEPAALARYAGVYDVDERGKKHVVTLTVAGSTLQFSYDGEPAQALVAFSPTRFSWTGTWVEFSPGADGSMGILLRSVEADEQGVRRR